MEARETVGNSNRTGRPGIIELARGILEDTKTLIAKEMLAAKLEIKEEIAKTRRASILLGAGGFVFAIGVIMLSLMAVFLLDAYSVLPLWASLGIVGVLYLIAAGVLIVMGKRAVAEVDAYPRESVQETKQHVRYIKEAISKEAISR